MFGAIVAGVVLIGVTGPSAAAAGLTEKEFVQRADAICVSFFPKFAALPEGVDGAKPLGTGALMHRAAVALDRVHPPRRLATDWNAWLDLFDRAAAKLVEAQRAELSGRASDAQSEALWSLEPLAAKKFAHMVKQMHIKFKACSFGA